MPFSASRRRALTFVVPLFLLPVPALDLQPGARAMQEPIRRFYFKDSRGELALARARGDSTVSVVIAAFRGRVAEVVRHAASLGGDVRHRNDAVDYVRVRLPVPQAERIFDSPAVQAADIDVTGAWTRPIMQHDGEASEASPAAADGGGPAATQDTLRPAWPPRLGAYPITNAYSPLEDLDADRFLADHPAWDGRGVTIAVLDGFPDLLLPELQAARALDGTPIRKIVDYLDVADPLDPDDPAAHWVRMEGEVTVAGGRFTHDGRTYSAPENGAFRFGNFDEGKFTGSIGRDLNRDGNPPGSSRLFGVLWDPRTDRVWVDTDQDLDLAEHPPMTDYATKFDVGVLGRDDPATPIRETVGFGVQIDRRIGAVAINPGIYGHGTMVHGAAAASTGNGGRVQGVAPGARLVAVRYTYRTSGLIEGLIRAFEHPAVDVVLLEQNVVIAIPYILRDGRFTPSIILDRLVAKHQKPFFVPASNSSGLGLTSEHGVSDAAIGVGAYQSAENYLINNGLVTAERDNLHSVGAYGPGGAGALIPDLMAPSAITTVNLGFTTGRRGEGLYQLPPGYEICGGTSCATPVAAGAAALLISAARQAGVRHDPDRLRYALHASTRPLTNILTHQQGRGLLQVGAAWQILQQIHTGGVPVTIVGRGPIRTVQSHWLQVPHQGAGIYEREGWQAGDRGTRVVTLTRTSGPRGPMSFQVTWVGDGGTFTSDTVIRLPLNAPVELPVTIAPATPGAHSALLTLTHPDVPGRAYQMLATVVAAHQLRADAGHAVGDSVQVYRPGRHSFYLNVPAGTGAFTVDITTGQNVRTNFLRPDGRHEVASGPWATGTQTRTVTDPMPGVWEILIWSTHDLGNYASNLPAPLPTITTMIRATRSEVGAVAGAATTVTVGAGGSAAFTLDLANRGALFRGGAAPFALGSALETTRTIAPREQQIQVVDVPAGSTALIATVAAPGATDADLDLYLFNCTGTACEAVSAGTTAGHRERVEALSPAAGRWIVVVDATRLPGGPIPYDYQDVVVNPMFGGISVADAAGERTVGAAWQVRGNAWVASPAGTGRHLLGMVPIVRDAAIPPPAAGAPRPLAGGLTHIPLGWVTIRLGPDPGEPAGRNQREP